MKSSLLLSAAGLLLFGAVGVTLAYFRVEPETAPRYAITDLDTLYEAQRPGAPLPKGRNEGGEWVALDSSPADINDRGQIAGSAGNSYSHGHGREVLWQNGRPRRITAPGLGPFCVVDINNRGEMAGYGLPLGGRRWQPFLLVGGKVRWLGMLPEATSCGARALNEKGHVLGYCSDDQHQSRGFLWENGRLREFESLPGRSVCITIGMNNRGQVVGTCRDELPRDLNPNRAFLHEHRPDRPVRAMDLNDLIPPRSGWTLWSAIAINDRGCIVGVGERGGMRRGFLLTPR